MKPHLLVASPLGPRFMDLLEQRYTLHRLDTAQADTRDAVLAGAGPLCSAMLVSGHFPVDGAFLDRLPALRLAACSSAGFDQLDLEAMTLRGITLTNTSPALVDDVADTAIMLMLAARRRLVQADAYVRAGDWAREGMFPLTPSTAGKRAGIVGLGHIGMAIATRCQAMGLTIAYTGRNPKPDVAWDYFPNAEALAEWADILLIATPGGADTQGLIDGRVLKALGPAGTLINIARGTVVDEAALIAALTDGLIASAGLDVFLNEPDPDPRLTALSQVTLYPHHASGTHETRDAMAQMTLDNLEAFFAGKPLLTPVN